jgi:hypothetical protein
MTASYLGASASAACPVVLAGNGIGGDHATDRLRLGHGAVTARQRRLGLGVALVGGRVRGALKPHGNAE